MRTLFEQAYANMAGRAVTDEAIEAGELDMLPAADLPDPETTGGAAKQRIGLRGARTALS